MTTKITYLVDYLGGPQAGTEGQLLQLIKHLDRTRYEPELAVLRGSEYVQRNLLDCPVHVLAIVELARVQSILKMMRFARDLRRRGCRLVHCFLNDVSILAPPLLRMFGIRVLVSRRDMGVWYSPARLTILRLVSPFVTRYVANCHAVACVVNTREWASHGKISVIYNGIGNTASERTQGAQDFVFEVPAHAAIVGIVANLKPIKRIDVLVRAAALARRRCPNIRLIIVGNDGPSVASGSVRAELVRLAGKLGIHDNVIFTGRVNNPEPLIEHFSVAVICSESEGVSNSLLEYMRAGRPIICTDAGGNPELIQDGTNGFVVRVGDADALADRLVKLLCDSVLARRLGEAARETVRSTYPITRMVREQMACYDDVLSGRHSSFSFGRKSGNSRQC